MKEDFARYRLEKAKKCLDTAEICLRAYDYEAATNRSYYAVFHSIRSILALDEVDFNIFFIGTPRINEIHRFDILNLVVESNPEAIILFPGLDDTLDQAILKLKELNFNKRIEIALTYIYGIGRSLSNRILADAKVDMNKRAGNLSNDELNAIRDEVNKYMTEGDLRREVNMNIKTKMEINSYQGTRHKKGLPVRGQRTNRNAVTARGGKKKVVANKKK